MKKIVSKLFILPVLLLTFVSCKKTFEKTPGSELDGTLAYQNVNDANAAVMGIYGKFMGLADRYIILNELRADLLDYTMNADEHLQQISNHNVSSDNPYASPRPFYEIIINCNDVIFNFNNMYAEKKLSEAEYNERYSDIACLRSFLYLQLGIHYGDEVRYVTDPVNNLEAINNQSLFPKIAFNALIDSLINFTEAIPFKGQYLAGVAGTVGPSLNITLDGYPTNTFFIQKRCLLGDLYLWKGDYTKAATYYREVMELSTGPSSESGYGQYKLAWGGTDAHYVGYVVANNELRLNYDGGWRIIFNRGYDANFGFEWLWALPYDNKFGPANPLIKLFSPIGGEYLVKPSQAVMDNWASQRQGPKNAANTTIPYITPDYDARGPLSAREIGGQPVVMKYLYNYINHQTNTPLNPFQKDGKWWLYRQTHLHLHYAEAANRDGHHKLAYAIFDAGMDATFAPPAGVTNVTSYQNTLDLPKPYDIDARNSNNVPYFRGAWYRHIGIRRRAGVLPTTYIGTDSLVQVEDNIINEGALENAFEGSRWPDLVRIALRRNDPSFLADKIFAKLQKAGLGNPAATRARLMDKANWYLPFKL